ncbi:hypothetical protein [Jannaschia sp. W003]|uniref:hypothetical protein n=1 Tax=Jannaschia sp. W003 TaxID=2867012 RepID=UPI0021A72F8A|nr:hypothetical protein [Jannaschia sp. W003]UWQ20735.1 hypothetical protein K3554_12205 [Jannaschia sp. W003]
MYARITPFKMKRDKVDAAKRKAEEMRPRILALPGMKHFTLAMDEDGKGYVVSLVESREISEKNKEKVKALWGELKDFLETMPKPEGYEVVHDWQAAEAHA